MVRPLCYPQLDGKILGDGNEVSCPICIPSQHQEEGLLGEGTAEGTLGGPLVQALPPGVSGEFHR